MPVKTAVLLKEEIHEHLVERVGRRRISETINQVLEKEFLKPKKSMFGADPWVSTKNLRDEYEPPENL